MFVDEIVVEVYGGKGGNGMVSFRREKYVEFGGPSGGNGGNGGNVIFVGDEGMNTLSPLKFQRHIKADAGENGKSKSMHGKTADDSKIKVPLGTSVYHSDGMLIGEVMYHNQELVIARGGKGGRGNISFATQKNPAPEYAENGDLGQNFKIRVELKVLADVGLIGLPNAGKSTLISVLTNAKPKIADYPFTTLNPNLGMVLYQDNTFVMADLPGLIENAHQGEGLGIQFLKHVERCRVLIHVIDASAANPVIDEEIVNKELESYSKTLAMRPKILVINKIDILTVEELTSLKKKFPIETIYISAYTRTNLTELLIKISALLTENPVVEIDVTNHHDYVYKTITKKDFDVVKNDSGVFILSGEQVELLFNRADFTRDESVKRFARQLRLIGADEKLRELGAKNGDAVRIFDYEFEFID